MHATRRLLCVPSPGTSVGSGLAKGLDALFVKLGWLEVSGRSQYHILDRAELQARAIS